MYGQFSKNGDAFRIDTLSTPTSWDNFLVNDIYALKLSQRFQNESCLLKPERVGIGGTYRTFYLLEKETGCINTLCGNAGGILPQKQQVSHYLSHSVLENTFENSTNSLTVFVPHNLPVEIWRLEICNTNAYEKNHLLFSVFPFSMGNYYYRETDYCSVHDAFIKSSFPYNPKNFESNKTAMQEATVEFLFTNTPWSSYDCSANAFYGTSPETELPEAVKAEKCSNTREDMRNSIAACTHQLMLAPGETAAIDFVFGAAGYDSLTAIRKQLSSTENIDDAFQATKAYWYNLIETYQIETPDEHLNHLVNYWLKKQSVIMGRNRRMTNDFPVRNLFQDSMGYATVDPQFALEEILSTVRLQDRNGFMHQWMKSGMDRTDIDKHPTREKKFMDAGVWLVISLDYVIRQLGDDTVLELEYPFYDSHETTSLYQHLLLAVRYLYSQQGERGLILLKEGDWFDPLNGPGRKGFGESTWLTEALIYAARCLLPYAQRRNDQQACKQLNAIIESLSQAVNQNAWDGNWYQAGISDDGRPFGTHTEKEGYIYLNPQSWALIGGIASEERMERTVASMQKELSTPYGSLILFPAYTEWNDTVGRISVKTAGTTENGSVYCHGSAFAAFAYLIAKKSDLAYQEISRILPTNPENPPENNGQLPTYIPNYYFYKPDSIHHGKSSCHNSTGTVSWILISVLEYLLGMRVEMNELVIDPCIPHDWKELTLRRKVRNSHYRLTIKNPDGVESGVKELWVNGKRQEGNRIPIREQEEVNIITVLGK